MHNVAKLKFGDLEIEFDKQIEPQASPLPGLVSAPLTPDTAMSDQEHKKQTQQSLEDDEVTLREEQLALAFIENPSRAEELLLEGELVDDDESGDDGDE